jgi:glycosyltransferase involved in cell wall biosynthesis
MGSPVRGLNGVFMARLYDIVIIGDVRFPGGTSAAIAAEIEAQARAGFRTAVLAIKAPVLKFPHPIHPQVRALLELGKAELLDPETLVEAGLAVVHHPQVLTNLPVSPLRVRAEHHLLVVHHPPFDSEGKPFYDWRRIDQNAAALLGRPVPWAPVGPAVRAQLASMPLAAPLWPGDWHNVLDPSAWAVDRAPNARSVLTVGRHSRPDLLKWPATRDETLLIYPPTPEFRIRVLGSDPAVARFLAPLPANWELVPFGGLDVRQFLGGLDAYAFFHHPRWVEAFGRTLIEAMAAGLPVLLPEPFHGLFGEAARYVAPDEAATALYEWLEDPAARYEQGEKAKAAVASRFSFDRHVERVAAIVGRPAATTRRPRPTSRVVLFFTSNGVGLGHVTRALAVAKRCGDDVEPVFVTLSQAAKLIDEAGYAVEYLPFHAYLGADVNRWNHYLAAELGEMVRYYDPRVVVFDGNTPYSGLIRALQSAERGWAVWMRRGFWRPGSGAAALERESAFDAVIEPEDLADVVDRGPTAKQRGRTLRVPPIRLLDPPDLLSREEARRQLGLPVEGLCVLLQLGAGTNFDFGAVRERVLARLATVPDLGVAMLESPIGHEAVADGGSVRLLRVFPSSKYLHAFDGAVSAVGYNSFHELVLSGTPTLFVPNEHPMMDDQRARAEHAERMGWALAVRTAEIYRLGEKLDRLLDPEERDAMRGATGRLSQRNGAVDAARILGEMCFTTRADRSR